MLLAASTLTPAAFGQRPSDRREEFDFFNSTVDTGNPELDTVVQRIHGDYQEALERVTGRLQEEPIAPFSRSRKLQSTST